MVYVSRTSQTICRHLACKWYTLRKLYFYFLSHWIGYDRGDRFPFDFEPNGNPFGSKSKGKLSPRSFPIQFDRKWKYNFLSVGAMVFFFFCSYACKVCQRENFPGGFGGIKLRYRWLIFRTIFPNYLGGEYFCNVLFMGEAFFL